MQPGLGSGWDGIFKANGDRRPVLPVFAAGVTLTPTFVPVRRRRGTAQDRKAVTGGQTVAACRGAQLPMRGNGLVEKATSTGTSK